MTEAEFDPQRSTADLDPAVPGTAAGVPTEGVEITEAEQAEAVVPDDKSVDGPPAGHA